MKLPREIVLERERRAWELRQRGWTHERIAQEIGVERSAVTKALGRMSKRTLARLGDEIMRAKAEQLAQLEFIADEALQAWERSKEASKAVVRRQGGEQGRVEGPAMITTSMKDADGDPRYLEQARAAMKDIRAVLGFDVQRTELRGAKDAPLVVKNGGKDDSPDQLAEVLRILAEAGLVESVAGGVVIEGDYTETDEVYPAQSNAEASGLPASAAP